MTELTNQMFYTEVYCAEDFTKMRAFLLRCRIFLYTVTAVFVLLNLGVYLYYLTLPYGAEHRHLIAIHAFSVCLYMIFFVIYGIRFRRVKNYNKTLYYLQTGKEEETEGVFLYYTEHDQLKDDIEYYGLMFSVQNEYRKNQDGVERRFFFDKAKPLPPFETGDSVSFVSQGALIVRYKITQRAQDLLAEAEELPADAE